MTDLERVRDEYAEGTPTWHIIDAHLKEDAERDYRISFLENLYLERRTDEAERRKVETELAELREAVRDALLRLPGDAHLSIEAVATKDHLRQLIEEKE